MVTFYNVKKTCGTYVYIYQDAVILVMWYICIMNNVVHTYMYHIIQYTE